MFKSNIISIIIPLFNKQGSILKAINSVLIQNYTEFEIVVVDDGSTDNSLSIVESVKDIRIKIFKKENGGPASARNYGVKVACGKWILFLDADDTLEVGALHLISQNIKNHPLIDVFTYNLYIERSGLKTVRNLSHTKGYLPNPFINYYLNEIYPRTGNMVVKKTVMLAEPYNEKLRRHEDTEDTFRLMRKYRFYASLEPVFSYNQDTLEACYKRENIEEDFVCTMNPRGKSFFEQMCMYKLYIEDFCHAYPEISDSLYSDTFHKMKYGRGDKYLHLYEEWKANIRNMIKIKNRTLC